MTRGFPRIACFFASVALSWVALSWVAGCRPRVETAEDARAWAATDTDLLEQTNPADRWTGWRGNNAHGIGSGDPPVEFGPDKNLRWRTAVPGEGNSSCIVWKDRVFLTTALDDTDPPTLALIAYDRNSGKQLWHTKLAEAAGTTHAKNGYASATPVTDGEGVYVFLGSPGLFRVDMQGNRVWKSEVGDLDHIWGTAASPVLYEDSVIQLCDGKSGSYLAAFDKKTGKRLWKTPRESTGGWSTPLVISAKTPKGRRDELIVHGAEGSRETGRYIAAYDPRSGELLWRFFGTSEFAVPSPVYGGGLLFCASGRNGPIYAIRPGGEGTVDDSRVEWMRRRGGPYIPSPLLYRNRLYLINDTGFVTCYNPGDGEILWRDRLRGQFTASPVAVDGRIYAVSEQGTAYAFKAADEFNLLATNKLGERCLASPVVVGSDLFIRTVKSLFCFRNPDARKEIRSLSRGNPAKESDAEAPPLPSPAAAPANAWPVFRGSAECTGVAGTVLPKLLKRRWSFRTEDGGFESTAAILDKTVYVGSTDGNLYAFDLASGEVRWKYATELGFTAPIAARDGRVYAGDADAKVYCWNADDGKLAWEFEAEAEINSGVNFFVRDSGEALALFGDQSGRLFALDAQSGKHVWTYEAPDQIRCTPAIARGTAFVAGCDGRLHAVDCTSGKETASVELGDPTGSTPAIVGNMAYVGTEGNRFFAVDWRAGDVAWTFESPRRPGPFRSSAMVSREMVVVGSRDKALHALDPRTGEERWSFRTGGRIDGSPVLAGDTLYFGSADGKIYAVELASGKKTWEFEAAGSIVASPAVAEGVLVVGTDDGDLFCFGEE